MSITNLARPSSTFANIAKVGSFETWATITTTWATETRTWAACASLFTNTSRASSTITNLAKPI